MKKLISILLVAIAALAGNSCDNRDREMDGGSVWYIQASNTLGFSDKENGVFAIKLSNGWATGKIQLRSWPQRVDNTIFIDDMWIRSVIGNIVFNTPTSVTISDVSSPGQYVSQINGDWSYQHDTEYDTHILRRGSEYIIF